MNILGRGSSARRKIFSRTTDKQKNHHRLAPPQADVRLFHVCGPVVIVVL
jgi:hypothetical protein